MASTFTNFNSLEKPGIGEQSGVWGVTLNLDLDKIDNAINRVLTLSVLTNPTISTSQSAVSQFNSAGFIFTGDLATLGADRTVTFPSSRQGVFVADFNGITFGDQKLIMKVDGETVGVTATSVTKVQNNGTILIYTDGTSMLRVGDDFNPYILNEIRMWAPPSGFSTSSQIPDGWHICNGNNGTPDLRNRFVQGSSDHISYAGETKTGGNATDTISLSDISLTGNTGSTILTTAQIPNHSHFSFTNDSGGQPVDNLGTSQAPRKGTAKSGSNDDHYTMTAGTVSATLGPTSHTGGSQGHTHPVNITAGSGTAEVSTVPPYYRIIYIQYTGT